MNVLLWHVHGSWATSFVHGADTYLLPVDAERSPDGRGRAQTWQWPASAREVAVPRLRHENVDVVVLQRPRELDLLTEWTGLRAGADVPAVYVEHDTPRGPAADTRHVLADRDDITLVHVTAFNAVMWNNGRAPVRVIEHGIPDPGPLWSGERSRVAAVVNEPMRRWRIAGTDVLIELARRLPAEVYGAGVEELAPHVPGETVLAGDRPQEALHRDLAGARAYLHPYRWTSLGLALVEAMTIGMPVLALAATAAPETVPPSAGVVSSDPDVLAAAARRWLADPAEARPFGDAARRQALERFGLDRFLSDWHDLLQEVTR